MCNFSDMMCKFNFIDDPLRTKFKNPHDINIKVSKMFVYISELILFLN